jgi:CCR4-NOT transcriptional regulation complex NOT5 subunit
MAQQKLDTVILKNGKTIPGYIYKMENGLIYIANTADSLVFTADQVQTLMFCHSVRSNGPCASAAASSTSSSSSRSSSGSSKSFSRNADTFSSIDADATVESVFEKDDAARPAVLFSCNMCGASGNLSIKGTNSTLSTATYTFTLEKGKSYFVYAVKLLPGEYNWKYSDTNNNETKGSFIVNNGEKKKIVLFEKE